MNLHWLDVVILVFFMLIVAGTLLLVRNKTKSVADFLAGSRCAGRYLLTVANAIGGFGAVSAVAIWELNYKAAFAVPWWGGLSAPAGLIITLSGWVIYRYRQTRALTLAQFFEIRYSRNFRVFAGFLSYFSGVLNYGIFPSVGARFFMYFLNLPENAIFLGGFEISLTYAALMAFMLGFALWITLSGGQMAIMITDCVQGVLCLLAGLIIANYCLRTFSWTMIGEAFQSVPDPERMSMVNPFKTSNMKDFSIWYYLIGLAGAFYGTMSWQGNAGYGVAAKSPHEARMANVLGMWRGGVFYMIMGLMGIFAFTMMHHPSFTGLATQAQDIVANIASPTIRTQMTTPVALRVMLPTGLIGLLAAVMLAAAITTDDTYLHSWGSIFIQDVIMPFRKKAYTPEQHLRALRWSITGVAIFGFLFSLLFRQSQYILMFFAMTGAIFLGGAGSVIVGGLYWKRGTTAGAWCAMATGSFLAVSSMAIQQAPFQHVPLTFDAPAAVSVTVDGKPARRGADGLWHHRYSVQKRDQWVESRVTITDAAGAVDTRAVRYSYDKSTQPLPAASATLCAAVTPPDGTVLAVPPGALRRAYVTLRAMNGQILWFFSMLAAIAMYIVVSLLGRKSFDMDRMLHRGKYAVASDIAKGGAALPTRGWRALIGLTPEFTRGDRILYVVTMSWSLGWMVVYFTVLTINLIRVQSDAWWLNYFKWVTMINLSVGVITTIWFSLGSLRDMRRFFRDLSLIVRNHADDGRVVDHHNAGE